LPLENVEAVDDVRRRRPPPSWACPRDEESWRFFWFFRNGGDNDAVVDDAAAVLTEEQRGSRDGYNSTRLKERRQHWATVAVIVIMVATCHWWELMNVMRIWGEWILMAKQASDVQGSLLSRSDPHERWCPEIGSVVNNCADIIKKVEDSHKEQKHHRSHIVRNIIT
jgi:hypothetical protein